MSRRVISIVLLGVLAFVAVPVSLEAQLPSRDRLLRNAKNQVKKAGERIANDAVACAVGNKECVEKAKENGEDVVIVDGDGNVITDENGDPITDPDQAEGVLEAPGTGRWIEYDYIRGASPIYNTWWNVLDPENPPDMIPNPEVRIGRIPPQIEFKEGNMQMIDLDGRATLEMRSKSVFHVPLSEPLPDDFSLEWTMHSPGGINVFVYFEPVVAGERKFGEDLERHFIEVSRTAQISYRYNAGSDLSSTHGIPVREEFTTVKFQLDDGYALMYINGDRVAQIPGFKLPTGSSTIEFFSQATVRSPVYISDIRVDYGVDDPVEVFTAEEKYVTRSIFFDFNSSALRPESTPELERIYGMLSSYREPVVIEGHTDAIGPDDYNLELSESRAQAVKDYLVEKGLDAALIEAVGKGETDPISDNESDEGRQANRRVVVAPVS